MAILSNVPPIKIFWLQPEILMQAQINMPGAISYPVQDLVYDNVSAGSYTDLSAGMTFILGTTPGADDLGRGRLRAAPTSTILKVNRSSQGTDDGQLSIINDSYVTVLDDFRVWSKIPVIGPAPNYTEYKDTDIPVGDLTEFPPPVAILGGDFAGSIDPVEGTLTVFFAGSNSYAVADGATITTYAWDAGGGTFVNDTSSSDADVWIEFEPGVYWVTLTVTDSNAKTHTSRRLVLADDPDDSLCVSGMQVQNITRTQQGTTAQLRVLQDLPRSDYPDGAHILIFEDRPSLDGVSRDHMLFTGWHQTDQASSRALETHLQRETVLTCVDVLGRLDSLPGFPQRVEVPDEEEGLTWGEMPAANMDKFLHYLIHWHSTAAEVADFYTSGTWDEYTFVIFDSAGATLYEQVQRQANRIVPDHNFTCDRYGAMRVVVDPMCQDPDDRTATIQNSVTEQGWQEIDFGYQRPPRVHTLRGSALQVQSEWEIDAEGEKQLLTPLFSIAPGTAPGQGGRESTLGERLAKSQDDLNMVVGQHYARMNARYGPITLMLNSNSDPWDFDPAAHTWVQLLVPTAAPYRGIDGSPIRCLCKEVSIDYQYSEQATTWRARVTLERETVGLPALTEAKEEALPVGEQPELPSDDTPAFSPGLTVSQDQVAVIFNEGYIARTYDFTATSPMWDVVYLDFQDAEEPTFSSWVVDPFSPGYRDVAGGAINGFAVDNDFIWRIENIFGAAPSATKLYTFDVASMGIASNGLDATIAASFGRYQEVEEDNPWIMVVGKVNVSGTTPDAADGIWCVYSVDGGQTWSSEVKISDGPAGTDSAAMTQIGVWLSPRTPGYALTVAYDTSNSTTNVFQTTDWGATWSEVSAFDTGDGFGGTIHVPWHDNQDEEIVYFGSFVRGTPSTWSLKKAVSGVVSTVSPVESGLAYGPSDDLFGLTSCDENNQLLVACLATSQSGSTATHYAIFVSDDGGANWTLAKGPVSTASLNNLRGYGAAFSADDPNGIYYWGGEPGISDAVGFSPDFGATMLNKEGNLADIYDTNNLLYSPIGICGGPLV